MLVREVLIPNDEDAMSHSTTTEKCHSTPQRSKHQKQLRPPTKVELWVIYICESKWNWSEFLYSFSHLLGISFVLNLLTFGSVWGWKRERGMIVLLFWLVQNENHSQYTLTSSGRGSVRIFFAEKTFNTVWKLCGKISSHFLAAAALSHPILGCQVEA